MGILLLEGKCYYEQEEGIFKEKTENEKRKGKMKRKIIKGNTVNSR